VRLKELLSGHHYFKKTCWCSVFFKSGGERRITFGDPFSVAPAKLNKSVNKKISYDYSSALKGHYMNNFQRNRR
jgi:hypothetical protein